MFRRVIAAAMLAVASTACDSPQSPRPSTTTSPTPPATSGLDRAAVVDALDYWQAAAGITYQLIDASVEPRVLIRPGTDGLAPQGGGRALIDGTYPDNNRARSGLVVFEPGGGQYCRLSAAWCRYLYRHEIGHSLGFLNHSDAGLMNATPDTLTDRERRMIVELYSLPHGAVVEPGGGWSVPSSGLSGTIDDTQAAQDIIDWNMDAPGGASFRQLGVITRWELPVRVFLQQ
jgi:hypothetical protein